MRHVILDVETIKSFDQVGGYFPEKLGVSFVGVIEREVLPREWKQIVKEERYEIFEPDIKALWPILERADLLVGFNIDGFDMMTLKPYYSGDVKALPTLDLMLRFKEKMGHRISLDAIAGETLGTKKSGNGLDALEYYAKGELDKLASYCMKDVEITRDVYDYGRINKRIKYKNKWNDLVETEIDFEFTPNSSQGLQMSLI